ncbi:hypothetical protein [Nocardia terpenica]|uniref:Uncharacterized protein n=1 Tax=Nocardia terpenica TaxID=455432 RepID=A0A164J177_9NOCA|nr:hypothetical protein [Nocardia terpenica]ATL69763.1 hypothetical protein CRH09_29915 [Nocardia terpenica]KZM69940.1 hypothetical protein AWN90_04870 [Nocardia terpenica]MBF6065941.1 hypothetical protein [Nocardia terpenica]MBF6108863.1 hypothetical protein [Nocardia terpenica]MBF6116185.1 hypothetical protein [Nocardia terpenica]
MQEPLDATRKAIEAMTAWTIGDDEPGDHADFHRERLATLLSEHRNAPVYLAIGLQNLAGLLLLHIEELNGQSPRETLQHIASQLERLR